MFSKTDTPSPFPTQQSTTKSVLGSDLTITGDVTSTGSVEVHGQLDGNLTARGLVIGSDGAVNGSVSAESVEVKGRLDGRVSTENFTLRASAVVQADVTYATTSIENGAQLQGRLTLAKQPKA